MNIKFKIALTISVSCFTRVSVSHAQSLEEIVITSTPLPKTINDSAQPVSVLSGVELDEKAGPTLGATLANEPGVSASSFGPSASRPIIRGLGGDRIKILQNGVSSQDLSNASPDHATTVEPLLAEKIEVVRGPATILYGTSAIGGVVNILDNRIPDELLKDPDGKLELRGGTVDRERAGAGSVTIPVKDFAVNLEFSKRSTDDIDIPGFARTEALRDSTPPPDYGEPRGTLPYSDSETTNGSVGTSYFFDNGFIGAAFSQYDSDYGVPNGEQDVSIDLHRKRVDIRGEFNDVAPGIEKAELKTGIVDYEHTEYEGSEVGTVYNSNGVDTRLDLTHGRIGPFTGTFGLQYVYNDLKAVGEEALVPPSVTNVASIFIFEELPLSPKWSLQFGGRYDLTDISVNELSADPSFDTFGETIGLVWKPIDGYNGALSLAHTERAPTQQELYADGPHPATGQFEIGDSDLSKERSVGVDLTFRKTNGDVTGSLGTFYNRFTDYINLSPTGETMDDLPVSIYTPISAEFWGVESQLAYHLLDTDPKGEDLTLGLQSDYVWARDRESGEPLPLIPPFRTRLNIAYFHEQLGRAKLEYLQAFRQGRNADFETETPQYAFLNLYLSRDVTIQEKQFEIFARGTNLLNEKARDATSNIKDVAPLPGIGAVAGLRFRF